MKDLKSQTKATSPKEQAFKDATRRSRETARAYREARNTESLLALDALTAYVARTITPGKNYELARFDNSRSCVVTFIDGELSPGDPQIETYASHIDPFALSDASYPQPSPDRWTIDVDTYQPHDA